MAKKISRDSSPKMILIHFVLNPYDFVSSKKQKREIFLKCTCHFFFMQL